MAAATNGIEKPRVWADDAVKDALRDETRSKCAYCESLIEHVAHTHIEHIKPKVKFPELVVAWDNLTLACPKCNQSKSDYYSEDAPLLNPYVENPASHITFAGAMVLHALGSSVGRRTILRLNLKRTELLTERERRLEQVMLLLETWHSASLPEDKSMYAELIRTEVGPDKPYTAACRAFLALHDFPLADDASEEVVR